MNHSNSLHQSIIDNGIYPAKGNMYLQIGGLFSLAFALFQVSAVFWPAELVAYFGGPAKLLIEHPVYFILVCLIIGAIAAIWGLYALSGAGKFRRLPFQRTALSIITAIYILRGLRVFPDAIIIYKHPEQNLIRFLFFSLLALCIGLIHLAGIIRFFRHGRSEMNKGDRQMNILGIGPLLAIVGGSSFAILSLLRYIWGITIPLPPLWREYFLAIGIMLAAIGIYFWISSALLISKAFPSHKLEISGVYRLSRNPLYAAFIVFIIPGIAFICNDILILTASLTMFSAFKLRIGQEEEFLRKEFGEEFQEYAQKVAQLIPFVKM